MLLVPNHSSVRHRLRDVAARLVTVDRPLNDDVDGYKNRTADSILAAGGCRLTTAMPPHGTTAAPECYLAPFPTWCYISDREKTCDNCTNPQSNK